MKKPKTDFISVVIGLVGNTPGITNQCKNSLGI